MKDISALIRRDAREMVSLCHRSAQKEDSRVHARKWALTKNDAAGTLILVFQPLGHEKQTFV